METKSKRPNNRKIVYAAMKPGLDSTIIHPDLISTILKYFDVRDLFKLPTFAIISASLNNTIIQPDLINTILKYFRPSVKIEGKNGNISYYTQDDFNEPTLDTKYMKNVDICGILELVNPVKKFLRSEIRKIKGNVIVIGDANGMFSNTDNFNSDISGWDVSNVTNMSGMFRRAWKFDSDISDWDVSKVFSMGSMFRVASSFNSDISDWDVSNVTNMSSMFEEAAEFNSDISKWDVSNVTNMSSMFEGADSFDRDISQWKLPKLMNADNMFDISDFQGSVDNIDGEWKITYTG